MHDRLNQQVLFNGHQPTFPRSIIDELMETNFNPQQDSDSEDGDDDVHFAEANDENEDRSNAIVLPDHDLLRPSPHLIAEIKLLNIMKKQKMHLNAFKEIFELMIDCAQTPALNLSSITHARSRKTVFKDIAATLEIPPDQFDEFETRSINWLPSNLPTPVKVRPFLKALRSLLTNKSVVKEENLCFPHPTNPLSPSPPEDDSQKTISELADGDWWTKSWLKLCDCNEGSIEILVPVILYIDGIALDKNGRLTLTPLNMTLGIFNVETRKRADAWETLYFHPDTSVASKQDNTKADPVDNVKNLHNGLRAALESFKEACEQPGGIVWEGLPYGGRTWTVRMKFAIAYVIGDTDMHDKLCGKYQNYGQNVGKFCRHCSIPTIHGNNPRFQSKACLWKPSDLSTRTKSEQDFSDASHHYIDNVFHDLEFGDNPHNIHLATPGECLHMHQLGAAKRAVESFEEAFLKVQPDQTGKRRKGNIQKGLKPAISKLSHLYGSSLSRQSERDFPRTRYTMDLFTDAHKKEGKHYAGIILIFLLAIVSDHGKLALQSHAFIEDEARKKQIMLFELVLGMEEFLKKGKIKKDQAKGLPKMVKHFINSINKIFPRTKGMGTNTIKNHLYFHIPTYITYWGPPVGWDSAASESHHKTQIKAPSKNTQQNASTLIGQTVRRQMEMKALERVTNIFHLEDEKPDKQQYNKEDDEAGGSWYSIHENLTMKWDDSRNRSKPSLPQDVVKFCRDKFLTGREKKNEDEDIYVTGFTEHVRECEDTKERYIWRAHPSYRADTGQKNAIWYDWATFRFGDELLPCQILSFLDLTAWDEASWPPVTNVDAKGIYAVVRRFKNPPSAVSGSDFILEGQLEDQLEVLSCESIADTVAVVPNYQPMHVESDKFFVVQNRAEWLRVFVNKLDTFC
jgi:hypothetical protein